MKRSDEFRVDINGPNEAPPYEFRVTEQEYRWFVAHVRYHWLYRSMLVTHCKKSGIYCVASVITD